jgi:hypothetical protein
VDRLVLAGGPQVLADRHGVDGRRAQVAQHRLDLRVGLAEADHQPALRDPPRLQLLRRVQQLEAALVASLRAQPGEQARDGLDVVVEHLGRRVEHHAQRLALALEVRRQHLDAGLRERGVQGADGRREVRGAAVAQVVAVDRGQHHVAQAHAGRGLGHARGLAGVRRERAGGRDRAVAAAARAAVPEQHERGRAAREALPQVRAAGLLADGVEGLLTQQDAHRARAGRERAALPRPLGQARRGRLGAHVTA